MKKLQKIRNFWIRWKGWDFFGLQLPSLIALLLFIFLLSHMLFEICGIVREAIRIKCEGHPAAMECGRGPLLRIALTITKNTISVTGSDIVRNLSLLLAASIGWFFLYWRAKTADLNAEAARQSAEIADKVLTAEQITRAIEQLAHKKPSVRLGGILSLEKIALAQKEERIKIAYIFVSFIRTRARRNSKEVKKDLKKIGLSELRNIDDFKVYREQRLDVEFAVRALANIASKVGKTGQFEEQYNEIKQHLCDLQNTDLRGLSFSSVDLSNFNLKAVDFSGANLIFTNFNRATLSFLYSDVTREEDMPKFIQAYLIGANFSSTILSGIDFSHSFLIDAKFNNASLSHTVFENCFISGTDFESSKNLTQEQIDKAYCSDDKPPVLPEGLKPPSSRTPSPPAFHN